MPTAEIDGKIFDPGKLLDAIKTRYGMNTDRELAKLLDMTSPQISRIRKRETPLSSSAIIKIHEVSGLPIASLKSICGDRRTGQRVRRSVVIGRAGE